MGIYYDTTEELRKVCDKTDAGVYYLKFSSGKGYIGSSMTLYKRLREHMNSFRRGNHKSNILQEEYNKCGQPKVTILLKKHLMKISEKDVRMSETKLSEGYDTSLNVGQFHLIYRK